MTQSHEARCSVGVETLSAGASALIRSGRIDYALDLVESPIWSSAIIILTYWSS